jgi:hypothetical protein
MINDKDELKQASEEPTTSAESAVASETPEVKEAASTEDDGLAGE